jgi:hypothetical protein
MTPLSFEKRVIVFVICGVESIAIFSLDDGAADRALGPNKEPEADSAGELCETIGRTCDGILAAC